MNDVEQLLPDALSDLARRAPHDPDLAGSVRRRARRRMAVAASVAGVVAVAGLSTVLVAGRPAPSPATGTPATSAPVPGCVPVTEAVLPEWARTGFSDPEPRVPYVRGTQGRILAVLFAQPLTAPAPAPGRTNKILWVARVAASGDLVIDARQDGTGVLVRRVVPGGPGPSTVDLPAAGCWRLDLRWGPYTDSLALSYAAR